MSAAAALHGRLAQARDDGVAFDEAWRGALEAVMAAEPLPERIDWCEALEATQEDWRRAYEHEDVKRRERAVLALAPLPDEHDNSRRCGNCDAWLPEDADPRRRYCTERCRRCASVERLAYAA